MAQTYGLPQTTLAQITAFFKTQTDITLVKIYGSRAKGTYEKGSDIDLAIYSEKNNITAHIKAGLEALPTPYLFDVTHYESLTHQDLKDHINEYGIIIFKK